MNDGSTLKILYIADSEENDGTKRANLQWVADQVGAKKWEYKFVALFEDFQGTVKDLEDMIASSDAILFDYGGVSMPWSGGSHIIDHWNRFFIKVIEEFPSKYWFCISGLDIFEPDDKDHLKELGVVFYWDVKNGTEKKQ